jgi:hypothetical protein
LEFDNASGYSTNWDSAGENLVPLLRKPILWHSKSLKKLRRLALRDDVDLWFEDECHFQQHGTRCAMWIPPEETDPVILHAPTRKSIGIFGAVRSEDGHLVTIREKTFDATTFLSFFEKVGASSSARPENGCCAG